MVGIHPPAEYPHGDWGGGGGRGTRIQYYFLLSLSAFSNSETSVGSSILKSISTLEQQYPERVLVHYPMPTTEDKYRKRLSSKLPAELSEKLSNSIAYAVISGENYSNFHSDIHSFAVIEFDEYFGSEGHLNEVQLSKDLIQLSKIISSNESIYDYLKKLGAEKPKWFDALELKPGIYGIRFDLRKYASLRKKT